MKLSASNIGWKKEFDIEMYTWMADRGIKGLEIAPTRIFPEAPYDKLKEARLWAKEIKDSFGLSITSMQSIWYGRNENIFASKEERKALTEYTKKAIDFAQTIGCENLVFGCPRNRSYGENDDISVADEFFSTLGEYAYSHDTVLAMEANPPIYNTNFCNRTIDAFELVRRVSVKGFKINLDMGTMIENDENIDIITGNVEMLNHVHISEPGLAMIKERALHSRLSEILKAEKYNRYVSLEVKTQEEIEDVKNALSYMMSVFK